jgi:aldehyde dehydrogenase
MKEGVDAALVREIVQEVLGRLSRPAAAAGGTGAAPPSASGAPSAPSARARAAAGGPRHGVFRDADEACAAAAEAQKQLCGHGMAGRARAIEIVRRLLAENAREWGRIELEETRIGRFDHKVEKLQLVTRVPGTEALHPSGTTGDHGLTLEEHTPFGVIAAITPSTHSIPTVAANLINMVAAGNAVVFNPHPSAARCAALAVRTFNQAIHRELGIENLACILEEPTLDGFKALCDSELVALLCVTGGPGVVAAAMQSRKRAVCAGPGNPPVLVDDTVDLDSAARKTLLGAAFDNNLFCIGEKEVFVLDAVADRFMKGLERAGGFRLGGAQLERLTAAAFTFPEGKGAGCAHATVNRDLLGKDPAVLARAAGVAVPEGTQLLFAEVQEDHAFVQQEQMMPMLPVVRVRSVEEGIRASLHAEHGFRHTAVIHSHDVSRMTAMARALDTSIFVKNGPSYAGLGLGGEGTVSFTIATPTGEGVTGPMTFTRSRRCVMVDNLRIW